MIYAIETVNPAYFVDLGGLTSVDINFESGTQRISPLMIASAKAV